MAVQASRLAAARRLHAGCRIRRVRCSLATGLADEAAHARFGQVLRSESYTVEEGYI